MSKAMKGIGIVKKINKTLLWHSLIAMYKSFVRPHLDIMVILFMTSQMMKVKRLKEFNKMLLLQLQLPSKESKLYNEPTS